MNLTISPALLEAIGWTLLHSLWQWTLLALLWLGLSRMLSPASARSRYQVLLGILLLGCLSSGLTAYLTFQTESLPLSTGTVQTAAAETILLPDGNARLSIFSWENIRLQLSPALPYLTGLWLLGVGLMSLRMGSGFWYLHRLRNRQVSAVPAYWQKQSVRLSQRLGIGRSVQVLESALIRTPMTLGHLKPVILLPLGMLSGMNPDQIEAILAHELAHIRRADYLVNLIQSLIEILFFFHPAVWWISREIRQEREACCDDLAVTICGDAFVYASALTRVQALRSTFQPQLSMNATGLNSHFSRRIQRLMGVPRTSPLSGKTVFISLIALLASLSFGFQVLAQSKVAPPAEEAVHEWVFTSGMAPWEVKQVMAGIQQVNPNFFLRELSFDAQNKLNHLIICEERTPGIVTCLEVNNLEQLHFAWRPEETQPAKFALQGGEMIVHPAEATHPTQAPTPDETAPLIVIDGVPSPPEAFEKIKAHPDRIESINVLKGEAAMDAYQEAGVNGVVEIQLKPILPTEPVPVEQAEPPTVTGYFHAPDAANEPTPIGQVEPLFIIEGVPSSPEAVKKIKAHPDRIASVKVLKGEAATNAYQEAGKNGVVEIRMKPLPEEEDRDGEQAVKLRSTSGKIMAQPLFVIDGKRHTFEEFEQLKLNPEQIERVNVLKGEAATDAYPEAGENGVVQIFLKGNAKQAEESMLPGQEYNLLASPNGFSDQARISFSLSEAMETQVSVLDMQGKVVQRLQNGQLQAGAHRLSLDGKTLSPGTYLIRLQTPKGQQTQRVVYQP